VLTVFKGANIIDGSGAEPLKNHSIVIEGSKIREITARKDFGTEAQVFDVSGKTIMPGLIDCHTHISLFTTILITKQAEALGYQYSKVTATMKAILENGCTMVSDCGGLEAGFAKAQKEGLIAGPRIHTCVMHIRPYNAWTDYMPGIGGTVSPMGNTLNLPGIPSGHANGPDECRKKVREMILFGAQFIKVINSSHVTARPWCDGWRSIYTLEELKAIVDEAHRAGLKTVVHGIGKESCRYAALSGADTIDHGGYMDEETLEIMAEKGTWWTPTYAIFRYHSSVNPDPDLRPVAVEMYKYHKKLLKKAMDMGVRIAMGTDINGAFGPGDGVIYELAEMIDCGMTPLQAIVTATKSSAEHLGYENTLGTLEPGKEADLLVVDGNPLDDIWILQDLNKLLLVMQAGKPAAGPMEKQFNWNKPGWPQMKLSVGR